LHGRIPNCVPDECSHGRLAEATKVITDRFLHAKHYRVLIHIVAGTILCYRVDIIIRSA
jgi:hypothetical protein